MRKKETKKEKEECAKKLTDFFQEVISAKERGEKISYVNIYQRVVWILED